MKFGVCTGHANAGVLKTAGWDYVEEGVQGLFKGQSPDSDVTLPARTDLPIYAANGMVPASLPIVGANVDFEALTAYMTRILERGAKVGLQRIVFGSGGARQVPEGFDRHTARKQILEFLTMVGPIAQKNGIFLVIEPLNKKECNILNTVGEAMTYVNEINHPNIQCLVDSYHFWLENESLANILDAGDAIRHVHVADKDGRVAPGRSGTADYRPFFAALKKIGYDEAISIECAGFTLPQDAEPILKYLHEQWKIA